MIATTSRRNVSETGVLSIRPSNIKAPRVVDASRSIAAARAAGDRSVGLPQRIERIAVLGRHVRDLRRSDRKALGIRAIQSWIIRVARTST